MSIELDIRTIIFVLGTTHLMQVLVFYQQYRVNKTYRGIGWWLMWSTAEFIGFGAMLFRNTQGFLPLVIIIQNFMIISGTLFLYFGVNRFFDQKLNLKLMIPIVSAFFLGLLYFLFVDENIQIRSGLISTILAIISLFTAYSLFVNKNRHVTASANFLSGIFLMHGSIFIYRTVMIFFGTPVVNIFTPTLFNILPYFDALIVSLLWTFGFIIMLNQRLNAEMSEAKEDLQLIFNTSPDAAIITRLDDGKIVNLNEGYTLISGYSAEEMSGKSTPEINIWKNITDRKEVVRLLNEKGHCENFEAIFVRKDGTEITGLMSAKVIYLQGIPHIISITRDITERKQVEEEIKQKNEELQKLNSEKDKFFSIIAHDLRGPFTSLLGFTRMMVEELSSLSKEDLHKIAVSMRKSATNLYNLLDNLLEWSRTQLGKTTFDPETFALLPKILEVKELVSETAKKKAIDIRVDIPVDSMIVADLHMFETIIRNLVFNAVKFTREGGKVDIVAKTLYDNMVEISIKDTGIGMSITLVNNLFNIDQNTNRRGTSGEPSTGLGLIICKEFIEKHGGTIRVESEEGKGSVFYFSLPSAPDQ